MKNACTFFPKSWFCSGLVTALVTSFSFGLQAQTSPSKQWDRTFGGSNNDQLYSIQQTADGGYILGGSSQSGISGEKSENLKGSWDYWIIKTDSNGNKQWDKTIGGNSVDNLYSLEQTTDGGFILGGSSMSTIGGDKSENTFGMSDYWVVKLDANGNKVWDKTIGGSGNENLHTLKQTSDGGYILGGRSDSNISGSKSEPSRGAEDFWIVKLDAIGNKMWDKTLGGNNSEGLWVVNQLTDGSYILGGNSNSNLGGDKSQNSKGAEDYWIVKVDSNGNKLWDKTFGGSNHEDLRSILPTPDGGYILGGTSLSGISGDKTQASKGSFDFWLIKVDANGNKIWDKTIGGNEDDHLYSLQITADGGFILGGTSESGISGDKSQVAKGSADYWVVKLNNSGNKVWDKTLGGNSLDFLFNLKVTSDGGYILGGYSFTGLNGDKSESSRGGVDYWMVKLNTDLTTGIKEPVITFNLSISPNPSQGKFMLQLSNLKVAKAEVTITDLLGRKVLHTELQVTDQQVSEEISLAAAKGMYVLQVKAGEEVISRKIVME